MKSKSVKRGSLDNSSKDLLRCLDESSPKCLISYDITGISHLFQQLVEPPQCPYNRSLISIGHFAQL